MDLENRPIVTRTITNPLDEDFTHTWNNVPYTVPARSTIPFVDYLAEHLAKHLANRILIDKGRFQDIIKNDKRIGTAVSQNEHNWVAKALLDRDVEQINLDQVVKEAKAGKFLPEEPKKEEIIAEVKEEKIGGLSEKDEFIALKEKGWRKLTLQERVRYKELKDKS